MLSTLQRGNRKKKLRGIDRGSFDLERYLESVEVNPGTHLNLEGLDLGYRYKLRECLLIHKFVQEHSSITSINLRMNGIARIGDYIAGNSTLKSINLDYNEINNEQELMRHLKLNTSLTFLSLAGNNWTSEQLESILAFSRKRPNLKIRVLDLYNVLEVEKMFKEDIRRLNIDEDVVQVVVDLISTRPYETIHLHLYPTMAEGPLFDSLLNCTTLRDLTISRCSSYYDTEGLVPIIQKLFLTRLQIEEIQFSDSDTLHFGEILAQNTTLKSLILKSIDITSLGSACLVSALRSNSTLTELQLDDTLVGEGLLEMASALQINSTLTTLRLTNTGIENDVAQSIGIACGNHPTLTELDFHDNLITAEGITALCNLLLSNTTLKVLKLSGNPIGPAASLLISNILYNTTLEVLHLRKTSWLDGGISIMDVQKLLSLNTTIKSLDISKMFLNDKEISTFTPFILTNSTLTELNINTKDERAFHSIEVIEYYLRVNWQYSYHMEHLWPNLLPSDTNTVFLVLCILQTYHIPKDISIRLTNHILSTKYLLSYITHKHNPPRHLQQN
eukprot:TRINITY_DN18725_c0_g1_i1.p1 TRINITY_DN18725_c0_g1~~TRINITY_DN18725_c0_g1_i1.p1  ORF type:complete len:560 (+),score=119.35 TRINITY_DN18725_c0_g1_i1:111-1790(+)